jgi:hypothetical protein
MKRAAESYLSDWRSRSGRKPLLLRGARQVGKTYLVESWGRREFDDVVRLDLERERALHPLFATRDPHRLLNDIGLLRGRTILPGRTLLFLDEVQACPSALPVLGDLRELVPAQHVVAAGSLLDFALRDFAHSMPVGRIEYLYLRPLSFGEFLCATRAESLAGWLESYRVGTVVGQPLRDELHRRLRDYLFVGGMPEAAATHAAGGSLMDVQRVQSSITTTLADDFAKYGTRAQQDLLHRAFTHVARNVGRKVKYTNVASDRRSADVARALGLLEASRVIRRVEHTSANGLPLGAEANPSRFKELFLDVGLIGQMLGLSAPRLDELLAVNEGALAEQFVGQELMASERFFDDPRLYYWHREAKSANAEVDYVIASGSEILPVEVKSARGGALKSMFQFLAEKGRRRAVRLYGGEAGVEELQMPGAPSERVSLLSLPLFLAGQVRRLADELCGNS